MDKCIRCLTALCITILSTTLLISVAFGEYLSFEWDANYVNDNVVSYRLYYSQTSGTYESYESVTDDLETKTSRRSATYKWTASTGTGVYYCELAAGGDPSITEPDRLWNDTDIMTESVFFVGDDEHLIETDFTTHANWDVTNDLDDSGGNVEYTWSANQTSTLTQESGDFAIAVIGGLSYQISYTVAVTTAPDGDLAMTLTTGIASEAVDLAFTAGTHTYFFTSATVPDNFVIQIISGSDTEGQFTIDDISIFKYDAFLYEEYWEYGDIDSLGYDTIYVRLTSDADPDTLDADAIQSSVLIDPVEYTSTYDFDVGQWYFVVTAVNDIGLESDYSEEENYYITPEIGNMGCGVSGGGFN